MDPASTAFEFLASLMSQPGVRVDEGAKPIVFEMLPDTETRWSFNPHGQGALLFRGDVKDAPLRIRCEPTLIVRLLTEKDFQLKKTDPFEFEGDLKLLKHLAETVRPREFSF